MFLDRERNLVIYDTPDPAKITGVVPGSKHLTNGYVAAPATLHNLQLLRWLGFSVPAPMDEANYDWPGRYKPFAAQRITSNFLAVHPRAFVLSDMGTGKTLAALWAADFIMRANVGMRCLIVAPLSTLQRVWADAIFQNFLGRRRCTVLYGDAKKRRKLLTQPSDFFIVNYDGVDVLRDAIALRSDIRMCIVDEASAYRDAGTRRHATARKILATKDYLWLMTGTPTPNGPTDAYGLAKLVNNAFGQSFRSYQDSVMTKVAMWKWVPRANAHVAVHRILQPSIRFAIADCIDLPPCTTQTRDVDLSEEQAKAYKELKRDAVIMVQKQQVTAFNEGVLRWKLLQIACIAAGTEVLTEQKGWLPIEQITAEHRVWDGEEFVKQDGAIYKGRKQCIRTGSVWTTADHLILSEIGWRRADAKSGARFNWAAVRLPYSAAPCWHDNRTNTKSGVAVSLCMRERSRADKSEFTHQASAKRATLRLQARRAYYDTRYEQVSTVPNMDSYASPMLRSNFQGLQKLRRAGHYSMHAMAGVVREFLAGYGANLQKNSFLRSEEQRRGIQRNQLSLGDAERTKGESAPTFSMVYDLLNCGPRKRFVVRGREGDLLIVHNCGAVYGTDHKVGRLACAPRLGVMREVIESCKAKIIICAPLTSLLNLLYDELKADYSCAIIRGSGDGGPSFKDRNELIRSFVSSPDPRILLVNPATMAHGLTLVEADTIIWYAPTDKTELYLQANKRIDRPGQTRPTTVVHLAATPIEREMYRRLAANESLQGLVLQLVKGE